MPTASENNPGADLSRPVFGTRRDPRTGFRPVGSPIGSSDVVQSTRSVRYKKKRPAAVARKRMASGRSALTIQIDSEKPMPRF